MFFFPFHVNQPSLKEGRRVIAVCAKLCERCQQGLLVQLSKWNMAPFLNEGTHVLSSHDNELGLEERDLS